MIGSFSSAAVKTERATLQDIWSRAAPEHGEKPGLLVCRVNFKDEVTGEDIVDRMIQDDLGRNDHGLDSEKNALQEFMSFLKMNNPASACRLAGVVKYQPPSDSYAPTPASLYLPLIEGTMKDNTGLFKILSLPGSYAVPYTTVLGLKLNPNYTPPKVKLFEPSLRPLTPNAGQRELMNTVQPFFYKDAFFEMMGPLSTNIPLHKIQYMEKVVGAALQKQRAEFEPKR